MTKAAAIYSFWSGFNLNAYEQNSVPTGDYAPQFPYLTYELITSGEIDRIAASCSLWYRDTSWTTANAKVEEISSTIGQGITLPCDDGAIIIRKVNPFSQSMSDPNDNMIKRKLLTVEYLFATKN